MNPLLWLLLVLGASATVWQLWRRLRRPPRALPPPGEAPAETSPEDQAVRLRALEIIREAHLLSRYLGFEHQPDPAKPSLYRISLALATDLDQKAAQFLQSCPYPCVQALTIDQDKAVLLLDTARRAPS
jgi:hypothetical protein